MRKSIKNACNAVVLNFLLILQNGQAWLTRSARSDYGLNVWYVSADGYLRVHDYNFSYGRIRPVITISKSTLKNL